MAHSMPGGLRCYLRGFDVAGSSSCQAKLITSAVYLWKTRCQIFTDEGTKVEEVRPPAQGHTVDEGGSWETGGDDRVLA